MKRWRWLILLSLVIGGCGQNSGPGGGRLQIPWPATPARSQQQIVADIQTLCSSNTKSYGAASRELVCTGAAAVPMLAEALRQLNPDGPESQRIEQVIKDIGQPAVEPLIRAVANPYASGSPAMIRALAGIKDPRVVPALKSTLLYYEGYADEALSLAAAKGLQEQGAVDSSAWRSIKDSDRAIRLAAARLVRETKDPQAVPDLIAALHDPDEQVAGEAAQILGDLGCDRAVPALVERTLKDHLAYNNLDHLEKAKEALLKLRGRSGTEALIAARLQDPSPPTRRSGIWILQELKDPANLPALAAMIHDSDGDVRGAAITAISELKNPKALEPLLEALNDDYRENAYAAEDGLNDLGKEVVPALIQQLEHGKPKVRSYAASALGRIGDRRALPALRAALNSDNQRLRYRAFRGVVGMEGPKAIPLLCAAAKGEDLDLKLDAVKDLGRYHDQRGQAALAGALKDPSFQVRVEAVISLAEIGDPSSLPLFKPLLNDRHHLVREAAQAAPLHMGEKQPHIWQEIRQATYSP